MAKKRNGKRFTVRHAGRRRFPPGPRKSQISKDKDRLKKERKQRVEKISKLRKSQIINDKGRLTKKAFAGWKTLLYVFKPWQAEGSGKNNGISETLDSEEKEKIMDL